jgi:inorganic pyrophosphatase
MRIDAIAIGNNPPEDVNVIIEVPHGGQPIKYEMDKEAGTLVVDRFLHTPMSYPGNYGFVPHTLSEDGDPIDVLVANSRELVPGCLINVRRRAGREDSRCAFTSLDAALRPGQGIL